MTDFITLPINLLPVLAFLAVLIFLDSYKLVRLRSVLEALAIGCLVALACMFINAFLLDTFSLNKSNFSRYVAPATEESLKSLWVIYLIRARRVGFMVDAAIMGFAIGAGFALVENIHYVRSLGDATTLLWVVRGFGTAVMHGSTTAIFGVASKALTDQHNSNSPLWFLPGLTIAVTIHSFFNHFVFHPLAMTAIVLMAMPLLLIVVFDQSERFTRKWLGVGLDADMELLQLIVSGEIRNDPIGVYLQSLKKRFPGTVVADMLCLLQIHLELSIRGKSLLMARKVGIEIPIEEDIEANLRELQFLEKAVGPTGRLAISPFLRTSSHDLWQLYMLGNNRSRTRNNAARLKDRWLELRAGQGTSRMALAVAFATMCLIWGSTWMMIKIGLRGAPPLTAVGVRFLIAALILFVVVSIRRIKLSRSGDYLRLGLLLGFCQIALPYVLVYWGELHISSGLTAVLYSTLPLVVAILARLFLGDTLTVLQVLGIGLGIFGVSIIFSDSLIVSGREGVLGVIAVLVSVLFAGISSVMVKKYAGSYKPVVALLLPFAIGGLLVISVAVPLERSNPLQYDHVTWGTILYLAAAGSVIAFTLFFWIVKRMNVTIVSYQTFIIPILAVLLGWVFLDEPVSARLGVGASCILLGIAIATIWRKRRATPPPP